MWCQYKNGDSSSILSQTNTKLEPSRIQSEVDWGLSYRRQKRREQKEFKAIAPILPPEDVPFKICRDKCSKKKKKRKKSPIKSCPPAKKRRKYTLLELSTMSQHKYMRYLSEPTKKPKDESQLKVKPRCCCCNLEPCPPRIVQLSRPNKHLVYSLWVTKGHILSPEVIERLQSLLYSDQALEPRDARHYFKKLDRMKRKMLKKKRQRALKKKQKKLNREKCWLRCQIGALCQAIVKYIRGVPLYTLNYRQLMLSEGMLTLLDENQILKKPNRNSKKAFKATCIEISDKLAFWMDTIIRFVDCQEITRKQDIPCLDLASIEGEEEEGETLYMETDSTSSTDYETDSGMDYKLGGHDLGMGEDEYEFRDSLKQLIRIMRMSGEKFLQKPANTATMGDFLNSEVLDMVQDFSDGKIDGYNGKPVLEPVLINWVAKNEPQAVMDETLMETIHDTSETLKDDFLRKYRSSKESKGGDDKPDGGDDKGSDYGKKGADKKKKGKQSDDDKDDKKGDDGGAGGSANKERAPGANQDEENKEDIENIENKDGEQEENIENKDGKQEENIENKDGEQEVKKGEDQGEEKEPDATAAATEEPKEVEEEDFVKKEAFKVGEVFSKNKGTDVNEDQNEINEDNEKPATASEDKAVGEDLPTDKDKGTEDSAKGDRLKDDATSMTPLRGMKHAKIGQSLTVGEKSANTENEVSEKSDKSVEGGQYVGGDFKHKTGDKDGDKQQIGQLEGDLIKHRKPIKVYEHQKGTICCLSLRFWAVWLMDITNNAHTWTKWMAKVIQKVRYFVAVIQGEVILPNNQQKKFDKFEWRRFANETNSMITAWRQYSAHVADLTNDIIENYSNKSVKCCSRCLQDMRIKNIDFARETLQSLTDAMDCVGYWRKALDDLVEVTKRLTNLDLSDSDSASGSSTGSDGCGCPGDAVIEEVSSTCCASYQRPENVPKDESIYELQVLKEELHQEPAKPRKSRKKSKDSKDSKRDKSKEKKKKTDKAKSPGKKSR